MGTFIVVSSTTGKCVSCKHYQHKDSFMIGTCVSEHTKIKSRTRYSNSRACADYTPLTVQEMDEKYQLTKE